MDLELKNKVAIITGASEGIGKATAKRLLQEEANVVIVARREAVLEKTAQELKSIGKGSLLAVVGDVTNNTSIQDTIAKAISTYGKIDILVNNAGTAFAKSFEEVSLDDWQNDFNLKVWSAISFIKAVLPSMKEAGSGRIINVTSIGGRTPGESSMPSSVSRATGLALTKALSKDLAKYNILVNTVCIGSIRSAQYERLYDEQQESNQTISLDDFYAGLANNRKIPLKRVGLAEEAGDVIAFLASERSSYLTGVAINIDGGSSSVL